MLPTDESYLSARGLEWEALKEGNSRWLVIHGYPIPEGYTVSQATIALMMPDSYPVAQIDMVYAYPNLVLQNGLIIGAVDVPQQLDGRSFQRWSRHRTAQSQWRENLDDVGTHLSLVDEWFLKEARRNV